jgi:starch synthase (maltosyl-transferring)
VRSDADDALPRHRPSRAVVEPVRPVVDGGRYAAKATVGRPATFTADVFTDGHDLVNAALLIRQVDDDEWTEVPFEAVGNDRHHATFTPDALGRWEYDVVGWIAHAETWRRGTVTKIDAGLDVGVELEIGRRLVTEMLSNVRPTATDSDLARLRSLADELARGEAAGIDDDSWAELFWRAEPRDPVDRLERPVPVDVDTVRATVGAWYSFFPRSTVEGQQGPGTLKSAVDRLDHIAAMGFDVVYIPPVHPIGTTNRKGKNNSTVAAADDVGSPYAIGSVDGGHRSVAPELGTVADVGELASACRERGMDLAIDIAFNCSPDHPWVREHPEWFVHRPDGSIQYAENPPKKYEDIYPLDFESEEWATLWQELADVFRFWIDQGVTIFRVDNPHTKSFAFWEWALATIRRDHPETIFLSEAFTRPRVMQRLAKIGFNQSYTYFAWRQSSSELREYFEELSTETLDYFRPSAWPNTHDILTEQMQTGGRPAFITRAVLAATLSPTWGIYGPVYELLEREPRPGVEDYLDSEKYQIRNWNLDDPDSIAPLITRLNEIRRSHPALTDLASIRFHNTDNPALLCFTKTDPTGAGAPVLVVVNVDPFSEHSGRVDIDLAAIGLPYGSEYDLVDRLGGESHRWIGNDNYVELSPWGTVAHVFTVHPIDEQGPA